MGLKSAWAYRNGQRIMSETLKSLECDKTGWVERRGLLMYAERYNNKLMVKTYSNKKQCNNKIDKLTKEGFDCFISEKHPFTINMNKRKE